MTLLRRVVVLALCAMAFSGCTLVSTSSSPTLVDPNDVPLGLLDPTIPFTDFAQVHFVTRQVYMVDRSQHVVAVDRLVTSPATLSEVLHYVPLGPTAMEQARGITTDLPPTLVVNQANMAHDDGVVLIDISSSLQSLPPAARRLAVAQLLFTAQEMGATTGIRLSVNQSPVDLTLANGTNVSLITPADLAALKRS